MFNKILSSKGLFFGYCIGAYIAIALIFNSFMSPLFLMALAESLASVLLAYWIAKLLIKFNGVRTLVTPVVFFILQVVSFIFASAVTHKNTGTDYAMWTCGIAFVLFVISQFIIKRIASKQKHVTQ
jgi:hypothetical protein